MAVKAKVSITISHLIDISSITRYYLLQSSTSAAPAKPTTNPPFIGKNLIDYSLWKTPVTTCGVTIQYLEDEDCFLLNGTQSASHGVSIASTFIAPIFYKNKTAALSATYVSGSITIPAGFAVFYTGYTDENSQHTNLISTPNLSNSNVSTAHNIARADYINCAWFYISSGVSFDNYKVKFQLEFGSSATAYQKYVSPNWQITEPSYTSGSANTLYFVDVTTFTDGTFKCSEVSKSSSYEAAKEAYNKAIAYVTSRNENLVTNGTASLGDNTNFSALAYDGVEAYYSAGSFKYVSGVNHTTIYTDEYIPVDTSQTYTLSYWIKSNNTAARYYDMLAMYDIDKNLIRAQNVMWMDGSTTTLAQDLKNGDTVVHLQSVAGFSKSETANDRRGLIFWNYKNSKGYQYAPETYSRNYAVGIWDDATAFDAENNTITLNKAWSNGTFPAGTSVSQSNAGSGYIYFHAYITLPANTWTQLTGTLQGVGKNNEAGKFREGTAFVRVGWLMNYTNVDPVTAHISTLSLTQNAGIAELNDAKNGISTLSKTVTDYYTTLQANSNSIVASVEKIKTDTTNDIDGLRDSISTLNEKVELQMTESQVDLRIDSKLQNGVNRVETSTGFKFDEDGLNVSKSGSATNTQITENGMKVVNTEIEDEELKVMLKADKDGVDAKNLRANTYLIVGGRSRFENHGTNRTGCFWIGE